jgi:tRNA splicing ligase
MIMNYMFFSYIFFECFLVYLRWKEETKLIFSGAVWFFALAFFGGVCEKFIKIGKTWSNLEDN